MYYARGREGQEYAVKIFKTSILVFKDRDRCIIQKERKRGEIDRQRKRVRERESRGRRERRGKVDR